MDNESLHWLQHVMQVQKRNRIELIKELPREYRWIVECRKSQVPAILLKIYIDSSSTFQWPERCRCNIACDFCFEGNSNAALADIAPFMNQYLSSNFFTWWHRYVRHATPTKFQDTLSGKTLHCFNLVDKPEFFKSKSEVIAPPSPKVTSSIETVVEKPMEAKPATIYRCKICHQPKKGHVCRGIAPPPIPDEPAPEIPVVPPSPQSGKTTRSDFASMFTEEKEERPISRLEKMFKKQRIENTTRIQFEKIDTDIDLLDQ